MVENFFKRYCHNMSILQKIFLFTNFEKNQVSLGKNPSIFFRKTPNFRTALRNLTISAALNGKNG